MNQATELTVGEQCVVVQAANPAEEIQFHTFLLASINLLPDKYIGETRRAFCVSLLQSEKLARSEAPEHAFYGAVLNKNTHFKQTSIASGDM